jgi:hypothetical protein
MAADSRAYAGDKLPIGRKTKIRRLDDGTLVGVSSNKPGQSEAVADWYAAGARPEGAPKLDGDPSFRLLAVAPDGRAWLANDSFRLTGPLEAEFFAIGSGEEYAIGALLMGADAVRAAELACTVDVWSALPVMSLRHAG